MIRTKDMKELDPLLSSLLRQGEISNDAHVAILAKLEEMRRAAIDIEMARQHKKRMSKYDAMVGTEYYDNLAAVNENGFLVVPQEQYPIYMRARRAVERNFDRKFKTTRLGPNALKMKRIR